MMITHDAGLSKAVVFDDTVDGVTTDDDGEVSINWDDVERVSLETTDSFSTVPHGAAFDTNEFYRLQATVARPIPQPYVHDDSVVWLKKPRAELQRAAWSLDNRPWTLGHPDTGLVAHVDDVRGFWDDTYYNETVDDLKSYLHVPVGDEEATSFIEGNGDVSVGFRNGITAVEEYDDPVGGEGPDVDDAYERDIELDGYQVDMYFDHVASVERGRCSGSDGCGIDGGYKGTTITNSDEDSTGQGVSSVFTQKMADSKFVNEEDDQWYAVPPQDNPDDEWKFPINNCSDVEDAWNLRSHGDISIDVSTLESRIKRRATDLDCDVPEESNDSIELDEIDYDITDNTMSEDCGCNDGGMNIEFDDLSAEAALDKVAAEHDAIESHLTELRERAEVADEAAEELDTDVSDVADRAAVLDEKVEELRETVDELQRPEMESDAEAIVEVTDRFGESVEDVIEACDEDPEAVAAKRELVEDLADQTSEKTATNDTEPDDTEPVTSGPVVSPWE